LIFSFAQSIEQAREYINKTDNPSRAIAHTKAVAHFARNLAEKYPEIDDDLVETAAWWHDTGRLFDPENHEKISAEMAYESLKKLKADKSVCKKVFDAIIFHRWSMQPETMEGEIIRDADKLDFFTPARWEYLLEDEDYDSLEYFSGLLPRFTSEFLHLEQSKKLYEKVICSLCGYLRDKDDPKLESAKQKVLTYCSENCS